jgi:hypothetical protein
LPHWEGALALALLLERILTSCGAFFPPHPRPLFDCALANSLTYFLAPNSPVLAGVRLLRASPVPASQVTSVDGP